MRLHTNMWTDLKTHTLEVAGGMLSYRTLVITLLVLGLMLPIAAYAEDPVIVTDPTAIADAPRQKTLPAGPCSVVNTATGRLITSIPIVSWSETGGMGVDFALTTYSGDNTILPGRPTFGWRHSYHSWVAAVPAAGKYQWNSATGLYNWQANPNTGEKERKPGNPHDLVSASGSNFTVRLKDATRMTFASTGGLYSYLSSIYDVHNNTVNLSYSQNYVTKVQGPSGRYLLLGWNNKYGDAAKRLEYVRVYDSDNTAVETYWFKYENSSDWRQLTKIEFPAAGVGEQPNYMKFEYEGGYGEGYRISKIIVPEPDAYSTDGYVREVTWSYTYDATDAAHKLIQVDGPAPEECRGADVGTLKYKLRYDNEAVGGKVYQRCRILDPLYTGTELFTGLNTHEATDTDNDRLHRTVHLYWSGSNNAAQTYGPRIAWEIGSKSTKNTDESNWMRAYGYDPNCNNDSTCNIEKRYPGCFYSYYEWADGEADILDPDSGSHPTHGMLISNIDTQGHRSNFGWDDRENLTGKTNWLGASWGYAYNDAGRVTSETYSEDPLHTVTLTTNSYNNGNSCDLTSSTVKFSDSSSQDLTTNYEYYSNGNLWKVTDPFGKITTYEYDNNKTTYGSNYNTYPVKVTDSVTGLFTETFINDMFGNPKWTSTPRKTVAMDALKTIYWYDKCHRLIETVNPDNTSVTSKYSIAGKLRVTTDEIGNSVQGDTPHKKIFVYDDLGNLKDEIGYQQVDGSTINSRVFVTSIYDELGTLKRKEVRSGEGFGTLEKEYHYYYDERNQLWKEILPGNKPGWHMYVSDVDSSSGDDVYSSVHTIGGGVPETSRSYKAITSPNQPEYYEYLGSATTPYKTHRYYNNGQLKSITGTDGTVSYTYDRQNRLLTCYQSRVNKTLEYIYTKDSTSHQVEVKVHEGNGTTGTLLGSYTQHYAQSGALKTLDSPHQSAGNSAPAVGITTQYNYDYEVDAGGLGRGSLREVLYNTASGPVAAPKVRYSYDDGSVDPTNSKKRLWLNKIENMRSDGSIISSFAFQHDLTGNRTSMVEANGDHTDYTYDASSQLTSEIKVDSQLLRPEYSYFYWYDAVGNRTFKKLQNYSDPLYTGNLVTRTYTSNIEDGDLLTSVTVNDGSIIDIGYDNFGNLTSRQKRSQGPVRSYLYDEWNRMTTAKDDALTIATFGYDILGRRVEKTTGGATTRFVYDGDNVIAETDSNNNIIAWYNSGICQSRKINGQWTTNYYLSDGLGSTRELTDDLQRVTDAYSYNAWGEDQGQLRDYMDPFKVINPYRYVGSSGCYSDDTGLILMGVRYYDPMLGRFITQDPIRDGLNWYAYAGNNPVNAIDPTGSKQEAVERPALEYHIKKKGEQPAIIYENEAWCDPGWNSKPVGLKALAAQTLMTLGALATTYKMPNASTHLAIYASGLFSAVKINLEELIESDEQIRGDYYRDRRAALDYAMTKLNARDEPYKLYSNLANTSPVYDFCGDLWNTYGQVWIWAEATAYVYKDDKGKHVRMTYTWHMQDPYRFCNAAGGFLDSSHFAGLAQQYLVVGDYTTTYRN